MDFLSWDWWNFLPQQARWLRSSVGAGVTLEPSTRASVTGQNPRDCGQEFDLL